MNGTCHGRAKRADLISAKVAKLDGLALVPFSSAPRLSLTLTR